LDRYASQLDGAEILFHLLHLRNDSAVTALHRKLSRSALMPVGIARPV
jgi:hypothetical protein